MNTDNPTDRDAVKRALLTLIDNHGLEASDYDVQALADLLDVRVKDSRVTRVQLMVEIESKMDWDAGKLSGYDDDAVEDIRSDVEDVVRRSFGSAFVIVEDVCEA